MEVKNKRNLAFGAVLGLAALYGVGWLTLRDVPETFVEWDIPTDPKEKAAYDLAHSIQLPDSVPKPQPFKFCKTEFLGLCFQKATGREYFEHLCTTEAGEYIFKTVEGVEGLYQMRQRKEATPQELRSLYRMEDPYGYVRGEASRVMFKYVYPYRFRYFEQDAPGTMVSEKSSSDTKLFAPNFFESPRSGEHFARYSGFQGAYQSMRKEYSQEKKSRYGFTWRGIRRERDRELGVAGGETIVVDMQSGAVLGFRRGFAYVRGSPRNESLDWEFTPTCPDYVLHERNKDHDFTYWFIRKVLVPPDARSLSQENIVKGEF